MSARIEGLSQLHEQAANGGILVPHGALRSATRRFEDAKVEYDQAHRQLVEAALPRHYRVVVWGSARLGPETPEYQFTSMLAEAIVSRTGCDIITGGGPGIMEAAPEGAIRARNSAKQDGRTMKPRTLGVRIDLPFEEKVSETLDDHTLHSGFSTRLDEFLAVSNAVYVAPGGIGTALELLMPLQLRQVGHIEKSFPIIVHPFWQPVLDSMRIAMHEEYVIKGQRPLVSFEDLNLVFSDNIPQIVDILAEDHAKWKENINSKVKREVQGKLF